MNERHNPVLCNITTPFANNLPLEFQMRYPKLHEVKGTFTAAKDVKSFKTLIQIKCL